MTKPKNPEDVEPDCSAGTYAPEWRTYGLKLHPHLLEEKSWSALRKVAIDLEIPGSRLGSVLAWLDLQKIAKYLPERKVWKATPFDPSVPACVTCNGVVVKGKCRLCKGEPSPLKNTARVRDHVVPNEP
jgi:hypothetical protein